MSSTIPYPYTPRQSQLIERSQPLAATFAVRAADHDRNGTFPYENFADLKTAGFPALVVPAGLGGWDASLLEAIMTMETLAVGDGSTALSFTMHVHTLGAAAEMRSWPQPLFEDVCTAAVERGALINAVASEPELGSPSRGGKPKTTATPVPGTSGRPVAWLLNGHKTYASMSPALDYMIIPALLLDGSERIARFLVPVQPPDGGEVRIVETWDSLGMRSTGSHDVLLHNVCLPDAHIIERDDGAKTGKGGAGAAWFMLTVSAVYLGVGQAALNAAVGYARSRVPTALGKPIAEVEAIQRHLGQANLLLHQGRLILYGAAELWDRHPQRQDDLHPTVALAKVTVTNNAITALDHCMRAVGGAAMTRTLPLERYYRDVRAGLNHPINDDAAYVMLGKLALAAFDQP
jgi:alkylation response protein AidB-like acyl-CoA dehydrogenase